METPRQDPALGALNQNGKRHASWFSFTPIAATLIGLALLGSGLLTIGVLAGYSPVETDVTTAIWLLNLDLVLALALIAVLTRKWLAPGLLDVMDRQARASIRLVVSFSLVAVIPALLVAAFSDYFGQDRNLVW